MNKIFRNLPDLYLFEEINWILSKIRQLKRKLTENLSKQVIFFVKEDYLINF